MQSRATTFTTGDLLSLQCPLQLEDGNGSGCSQQRDSSRNGCPFGHRSSAVDASISGRLLRPLPEHICIEHLLRGGHCPRPLSSLQVGNLGPQTALVWCSSGFHPQSLAHLERLRGDMQEGKIRVNDCSCGLSSRPSAEPEVSSSVLIRGFPPEDDAEEKEDGDDDHDQNEVKNANSRGSVKNMQKADLCVISISLTAICLLLLLYLHSLVNPGDGDGLCAGCLRT